MPDSLPPRPLNRLLAALPQEDLLRLWPQLKPVNLPLRQTVQAAGEPIAAALFIETGFVSMLITLQDGDSAEVGLVGGEGFIGLPLVFGLDQSDIEGVVQCAGTALQIDAEALRDAQRWSPGLQRLLLHHAMAHHQQVAHTAACNGRHVTEQRLARWLLMAHDRVGADRFPITHELLSMMLGLRRAGVTVAAGNLQRAGLIRYERGQLQITDRAGLEAAACECYAAVQTEFTRLFGRNSR